MTVENSAFTEIQRKQQKYRNMLVILLIMIGVSIVSFIQSRNAVRFDWTQTQVSITDPSGSTFTIVYSELLTVTLEEVSNYGQCLEGGCSQGFYYGQWQNPQWGRYTLCTSNETSRCIVLNAKDTTFVLSYESDETTTALYESILDFLL